MGYNTQNSYKNWIIVEVKSEVKKPKERLEVQDIDQEISNRSLWLERKTFRIVLISTFSALAIVLGYLLVYIPNIEVFTLMIFLSGFILGKRDGMIVGLLSSFIFCFFNPYGASPLPLLAFQLTHYSITGLIGALISDLLKKRNLFKSDDDLYKFSVMALFGFIGAVITINFQICSSVIDVLSFFGTLNEFLPYFLSGVIFSAIHIIGNTLGFTFILPGLIQLIRKMLY